MRMLFAGVLHAGPFRGEISASRRYLISSSGLARMFLGWIDFCRWRLKIFPDILSLLW
jgi:hypothetical protein